MSGGTRLREKIEMLEREELQKMSVRTEHNESIDDGTNVIELQII